MLGRPLGQCLPGSVTSSNTSHIQGLPRGSILPRSSSTTHPRCRCCCPLACSSMVPAHGGICETRCNEPNLNDLPASASKRSRPSCLELLHRRDRCAHESHPQCVPTTIPQALSRFARPFEHEPAPELCPTHLSATRSVYCSWKRGSLEETTTAGGPPGRALVITIASFSHTVATTAGGAVRQGS